MPWVTIMISPRSMKFMPSVAISEERPAVTTSAPTQAPSAMPVTSATAMPMSGLRPACTTSAKVQAAKAHRRREREVDLADGDDEHQGHDETQRDRQGHEHRIVDRPAAGTPQGSRP